MSIKLNILQRGRKSTDEMTVTFRRGMSLAEVARKANQEVLEPVLAFFESSIHQEQVADYARETVAGLIGEAVLKPVTFHLHLPNLLCKVLLFDLVLYVKDLRSAIAAQIDLQVRIDKVYQHEMNPN
jgi:hypothetical protein